MTDRIATHVADLVAGGLGSRGAAPRMWGVALVGMVRATADAWLAAGGAAGGPSSDELADDLTALVWDGLSSVARAGAARPDRTAGQASTTAAAADRRRAVVVELDRQHLVQLDRRCARSPSREPAM